jgi:hypothetical protein
MLNKPEHDLARAFCRIARERSTEGEWVWARDVYYASLAQCPMNQFVVKIRTTDFQPRRLTRVIGDVMAAEFPDLEKKKDPNRFVYFRVHPA